jgi:hypothetical protein
VPFETIAVPLLLLVNALPWLGPDGLTFGWLNSYRVQIVPFIADALSIFLFVQFFKDLPDEIIEAARIDGASWWQVYLRVIVPLSGPVFATAAILKFLAMYNMYLWPLMVAQGEAYRPVMVGLQYFFQLNVAWGEVMAYLSLITVPGAGVLPAPAARLHRVDRRVGGQGVNVAARPASSPLPPAASVGLDERPQRRRALARALPRLLPAQPRGAALGDALVGPCGQRRPRPLGARSRSRSLLRCRRSTSTVAGRAASSTTVARRPSSTAPHGTASRSPASPRARPT